MNFKEQFPVLDTCTYLNTASSGLISKRQAEWRVGHDLEFLTKGSGFRIKQAEFLQEVKVNVSRFFGAKLNNTFLVPNFSFGFNTFLEGLPPGQRFLLLQEDYPSVNYAIEIRGHSCDYLTMDDSLEDRIIQKIRETRPTVFAFSIVQYISGIKLSLDFLTELKQLFPDLLIVADGTQFCGTEVFNFETSGLDVLISSGYKWMLSGYGNGFVFLKDDVATLLFKDAKSRPAPKEAMLSEKGTLAIHFEPGHLDTLAFGTLNQSILFFQNIDFGTHSRQTKILSSEAKKAFTDRSLLSPIISNRKDHSAIFNLAIANEKYEELTETKIIALPRGPGVRVAFHIYNTEQDLHHLLSILDS